VVRHRVEQVRHVARTRAKRVADRPVGPDVVVQRGLRQAEIGHRVVHVGAADEPDQHVRAVLSLSSIMSVSNRCTE
jgi:thiamine monophosphate synthase